MSGYVLTEMQKDLQSLPGILPRRNWAPLPPRSTAPTALPHGGVPEVL